MCTSVRVKLRMQVLCVGLQISCQVHKQSKIILVVSKLINTLFAADL